MSWFIPRSLIAITIAGCATAPPTAALHDATLSIGAAEQEAAAGSTGRAAIQLDAARRELATAYHLLDVGEMYNAQRMLQRAKADADLAALWARLDRTRQEAQRVAGEATALEASLARAATTTSTVQ
jgi:hypothetical protein